MARAGLVWSRCAHRRHPVATDARDLQPCKAEVTGVQAWEVGMLRRMGFHSDEMALAFILWLCSLPLVALTVIPFFGLKTAGAVAAALVLFFVAMAICWGACGWKAFKGGTR